ncbi:hypothetical protein [Paracidovorax citrulli]
MPAIDRACAALPRGWLAVTSWSGAISGRRAAERFYSEGFRCRNHAIAQDAAVVRGGAAVVRKEGKTARQPLESLRRFVWAHRCRARLHHAASSLGR